MSAIADVIPAPPRPFLPTAHHGRLVVMAMLVYAGDPTTALGPVTGSGRWPLRWLTLSPHCVTPVRRPRPRHRRPATRPPSTPTTNCATGVEGSWLHAVGTSTAAPVTHHGMY